MDDTKMFLDLEAEIRDLFCAKLREFAAFCADKWLMSESEAENLTTPVCNPREYANGYSAAMSSGVTDALEFWIDEELGYGR